MIFITNPNKRVGLRLFRSSSTSLTRHTYYTNRHLIDISGLSSYLTPQNGWINNNPFALDDAYMGGKHGYTPEAKLTAVSLFEEKLANGSVRVIGYVLLGSNNLEHDMSLLRNHVQHNVSFQ